MVIIDIMGSIGHGKSTPAEAFLRAEQRAVYLETSSLIAEAITIWQTRIE
jgi:hypothetical protein